VSQFWKSHLRGSPSFVTPHSVLLHSQTQYLDGTPSSFSIGLYTLPPSVSSQYHTCPIHSFNPFSIVRLLPFYTRLFLLACHYYYSTTAVPLYVFCYPYPVFVGKYPFCRVKLLSEREVGKDSFLYALRQRRKPQAKKITLQGS